MIKIIAYFIFIALNMIVFARLYGPYSSRMEYIFGRKYNYRSRHYLLNWKYWSNLLYFCLFFIVLSIFQKVFL